MDIMNSLSMLFYMQVCAPLAVDSTRAVIHGLKLILTSIWGWLYKKLGPRINTVLIEYEQREVNDKRTTYIDRENLHLIDAVLYVATKSDVVLDSMKCKMESEFIYKIPTGSFVYRDFTILYRHSVLNEKDKVYMIKSSLRITSKKSTNDIYQFIKSCHDEWAKSQEEDPTLQFEYMQIPHKQHTAFMRYPLNSSISFDDIFFPAKSRVLNLVQKLDAGKIDKLAFCLHGVPGCGRTSFVKALANKTGKSIVTLKISYMKNDIEIKDIFNNTSLPHIGSDMEHIAAYRELPINKRIYLLEDLDAETDVCNKRDPELPSAPVDKASLKSKYEEAMRKLNAKKITLAGILNALDGVVEVKGAIIVVTTNHRDKLDPALLRYGRITMDIEMKKMLAEDAHRLISKYYPDYHSDFIIRDYTITPSALDAFCKQSNSITELQEIIQNFTA